MTLRDRYQNVLHTVLSMSAVFMKFIDYIHIQLLRQVWKSHTKGAQNVRGTFVLIPFTGAAGPGFC